MQTKDIKQALFGIYLTDGHLDKKDNLEVYTKFPSFHKHLISLFSEFPNNEKKVWTKTVYNVKYNTYGYRLIARYPAYFSKFREITFEDNRKYLTDKAISKITPVTLAYMWMGDGSMKHTKNKKTNRIQNLGRFSLESFGYLELASFCDYLQETYSIDAKLYKVPSGFGWNVSISGYHLQKFISLIYPWVQECFYYKTLLFYKTKSFCLYDLPSAEHFMKYYENISERDDIVQTYKKL